MVKGVVGGIVLLLGSACFGQTRFVVLGDYGVDGAKQAAVADKLKAFSPEFIVTTGDNCYFVGKTPAEDFANWDRTQGKHYAPWMKLPAASAYISNGSAVNNFFPVLGNHDWAEGVESYLAYFALPDSSSGNKRYYSFVRGPVEFFMLDSDPKEPDGNTLGSKQYEWAKTAITSSKAAWQVVMFHHPPYTYPTNHGPALNMRWEFKAWGADLVLTGHNHNMQILSVKGGLNDGLPVVVQGASGNKLYAIKPDEFINGAEGVFFNDKSYGFSLGEVTPTSLVFKFIDSDGRPLHSIDVKKNEVDEAAMKAGVVAAAEAVRKASTKPSELLTPVTPPAPVTPKP